MKEIARVTAFATFQALVHTASYYSGGKFPVVAFTLKEELHSRLYIGDSRHLYGCVIKGLHPVSTNRFQFDKPILCAKPEWMDRSVTRNQVAGMARHGRFHIHPL